MDDQEFPCRTKEVSGTTYIIKMYLVSDQSLRMSTSNESEEQAKGWADRMNKALGEGKYRFEITPYPWT